MKKGLYLKDIHSFEKSAESILGAEIDRLIDFVINHYQVSKDKFKIKFNEFQRLVQSWLEYESQTQEDDNKSEAFNENTQKTEYSQDTDDDFKRNYQKEKMKKLIELKVAKHHEKLKEIFENYSEDTEAKEALEKLGLTDEQLKGIILFLWYFICDVIDSKAQDDTKSEKSNGEKSNNNESQSDKSDDKSEKTDEDKSKDSKSKNDQEKSEDPDAIVMPQNTIAPVETKVRLNKLNKVLSDLAYLTGIGILSESEHKQSQNPKRSSEKAIDAFMYFVFEKYMKDMSEKLRKHGKSSLKSKSKKKKAEDQSKSDNDGSKADEKSDDKESKSKDKKNEVAKKQDNKKSKSKKDKKQKDNANQGKNKKDEKEVRIMDSESESGSDDEGEDSEGEGDSSDEETKKDDEFYQNDQEQRPRTILFEDEKYQKEQENLTLAYEDIQEYLQLFIESSYGQEVIPENDGNKDHAHRNKDSYVVVDLTHEFDDELSEDEGLDMNDRVSEQSPVSKPKDKFSKKLEKTIAEYEHLLDQDSFKNLSEKNDVRKLLRSLKGQLENHNINKDKKPAENQSIEEKREKVLHEIFDFYARQHIPPGLPFEKLEETLKTIQIGELLVFCKDFQVNIPRTELMLLYKKESENNLPHKFQQFKQVLRRISETLYNKKVKKLSQRIKEIKQALGEKSEKDSESGSDKSSQSGSDNEGEGSGSDSDKGSNKSSDDKSDTESKPSEKPPPKGKKKGNAKEEPINKKTKAKKESSHHSHDDDSKSSKKSNSSKKSDGDESGSDSNSGSSKSGSDSENEGENDNLESQSVINNRLLEEKENLVNELEELQSKTPDEVYEDFLIYLELDHPSKYKQKVKGLRLAFDVKDTKSRIPISMSTAKLTKGTFKKSKLSAAEIKRKVQMMKDERIKKKVKDEIEQKVKYDKNRDYLQQIHK